MFYRLCSLIPRIVASAPDPDAATIDLATREPAPMWPALTPRPGPEDSPNIEVRAGVARQVLHTFLDRIWEERRNSVIVLLAGTRISHVGHIRRACDLEDRPVFFSRLSADLLFYLERDEDRSVSHYKTTRELRLAGLGGLTWNTETEIRRFNQLLPSAHLDGIQAKIRNFEYHKNRAFKEWATLKRERGEVIDGWWRGEKCTEEILLLAPKSGLIFLSCESRREYRERVLPSAEEL
ncbi:hypothetical protein [Cereibacter sphaeroides]|uniref:hypothetical protein n=1 Tax=Cereibacter sphaeroides TaxID=1063 RepID=UPI000F538061|nr:hypothetical protein [Cereibacter sphaeroides]